MGSILGPPKTEAARLQLTVDPWGEPALLPPRRPYL